MGTCLRIARKAKDWLLRSLWRTQRLAAETRLFEDRLHWMVCDCLPGQHVGFHIPRGSKHGLLLRHHSPDMAIVTEVFNLRLYDPPEPVCRELAALGRPPRILDLGGHIGLFGIFALTLAPEAIVVSLEPDPKNFELLARTARRSGCRWSVLQAAAAPQAGWGQFVALGEPGSHLQDGHSQEKPNVEVVTLDVLPLLSQVDVAKIDVEGSEWPILMDPRWPSVAPNIIVLEFHPGGSSRDDYQAAAIDAIEAARMEYSVVPDTPVGAGMLWAWSNARGL